MLQLFGMATSVFPTCPYALNLITKFFQLVSFVNCIHSVAVRKHRFIFFYPSTIF
uniref:Uncharacterized protein n=1 Tax=Kalanchoe fedtschenkoi TaxID=63787 RepID=A0A7N0VJK1_KALFE